MTERFKLLNDGNDLEEVLQIADPMTFSTPWRARARYHRLIGQRITEDVCIERLHISDYQPT